MKQQFIYSFILAGLIISSCENYQGHLPFGSDKDAPGIVSVDSIRSTPGGAVIFYTSPKDEDVLYIKATFTNNLNQKKEVKSSAVNDSLIVEGYGIMGEYPVTLFAVDRGENHSEPTKITIATKEPAIHSIFPTLEAKIDYGGLKGSFSNPLRAEISINVAKYDPKTHTMVYRQSFFTSQNEGKFNFRGFETEQSNFGIYIEDKWGNTTDTLYVEGIPKPDDFLDKTKFSVFKMTGDKDFSDYSFRVDNIWDGRWDDQWNCGHTAFCALPHQLTIDLGVTVKLSRFKLYQRGGDTYYTHGNPKHFMIYGVADVNDLPPYNPTTPQAGWILIKDCYSFKPSGFPIGQVSAEDLEYQRKGEEFEIDIESMVPIRYLRFVNLETWGEQEVTVIGELSFWGDILD